MLTRSQHVAVAGFLSIATFAITADVDRPPGILTQTSETISDYQEAAVRDRIFYRNGESKIIAPEVEPVIPERPSSAQTVAEPMMEEPVAVPPEQPAEPAASDPLSQEHLLIQATSEQTPHEAPAQTGDPSQSSLTFIIAGGVIGIIVLGGILFLILRFLRPFRPTLSKEVLAPPSIGSETETVSPRLETALGAREGDTPSSS